MLIGEYQHSVDEKGRIALPAKFRKTLSGGVVVTKGLEPCLHIYPVERWHQVADKLAGLPANKADFVRLMFSRASYCEIDTQGRILIPAVLLEKAGIKSRAIVVGMHTRGEIWGEDKWKECNAKMDQHSDTIAKELGELNLA